jgi:hypothetical protein
MRAHQFQKQGFKKSLSTITVPFIQYIDVASQVSFAKDLASLRLPKDSNEYSNHR